MRKTGAVVKVINSGTTERGNSNLVTEFIARLRFSLNCHKSAQIENIARHKKGVGLPRGYTLGEWGLGGGGGMPTIE